MNVLTKPASYDSNTPQNDYRAWADRLFWVGVVLGCVLSWWYACNQIVDGDQLQMIHKGYLGAYEGTWLSFGNTASVVGNVPGSLLAWVVGVPLMVWDSPYAPMLLLIVLRLIGFLMLDNIVRQVYGQQPLARLVFLLMCWLNPWFLFDSLLYNPSYLIFCAGLHAWTAFRMQTQKHFVWMVLHVLAIGLAMQLHFSWPLLVFVSLMLFYRGVLKVSWLGVLVALALIGWSLIPYLTQLIDNPEMARHTDPNARERYIGWGAVHVYPVLKSVLYWLRYGAWSFPSKLVNSTDFAWIGVTFVQISLSWLWTLLLGIVGAITVVISLVANVTAFRAIRPFWRRDLQPVSPQTWFLLYALAAFVAALISAGLAPIVFNYWHLTLIFPFALFPILYWVMTYLSRSLNAVPYSLCWVGAFLILVNLVALNDSRKFSYGVSYQQQTQDYVEQTFGSDKSANAWIGR